jgi:outer membrane murein-binding lipoprotein Lpp
MSDIQTLRDENARLQAQVDAQALELIAARSNIADLAGTLDTIRQRANKALET